MKASLKWVVLTGVLMLFTPSLIHADGCYFSTESIAVSSDQRAIIIINGNEISMTFSTAYTGNSADFGWVIPTPVTPDPADIRETGADAEALFEYLGELTAPILETETGSGCFPSGTMVLTESGARPIESLHEGDTVWAYDTDAREWSLSQITIHRSYRYNGDMIAIQAGDVLLDATGNHQFMTVSSGSISWVEARNLLPGDRLLSKNIGIIDIIEVRSRNVRSEVYHLEVEPHHSYAVHEAGFVVHNGGKQDEGIATEAAPLVTVYGTVSLESYEVSILGAAGGEALLLWLSDNGYRVDASASDVLDAYANEGWTFVAVKMHPGERRYDNEFLPAVTIIYNNDRIIFPMRISSVSTNARVAVTLYVVADSTAYSPNYDTSRLDFYPFSQERINPELIIEGTINKTLGDNKRGSIIVWTGQPETLSRNADHINAMTNSRSWHLPWITRLETRINPEEMTQDIHLELHSTPLDDFTVHLYGNPGEGVTPLMRAIVKRQGIETINQLISDGPHVNETDSHGATALTYASMFSDDPGVIESLVLAGASVNVDGYLDSMPLYLAVKFNDSAEVIDALLAAGANPGIKTYYKATLIHVNVKENPNSDIIRLLTNAGVDLDAQDDLSGDTALHQAASWEGNTKIVRLLLELGADPKIKNKQGMTPLALALDHKYRGKGNWRVTKLLMEAY